MRKIILLIKRILFIVVVLLLVGCQTEMENKQTNNGGSEEMKFDFDQEVKFVQEKLDIDESFAKIIVFSLEWAGMNGRIIHIETLGPERRPFNTLEIKSEDGRTYRLHTSGGLVEIVIDTDTEEVLWQVIRGIPNTSGGNNNE